MVGGAVGVTLSRADKTKAIAQVVFEYGTGSNCGHVLTVPRPLTRTPGSEGGRDHVIPTIH